MLETYVKDVVIFEADAGLTTCFVWGNTPIEGISPLGRISGFRSGFVFPRLVWF